MATADRIEAATLWRWAQSAAQALRDAAPRINQLNVFPVPDSDTGSNMAHTMSAAVSAVEDPDDLGAISAQLAAGAVRGARGNSGVVLSQILRAVAEAAAQGPLDSQALVGALNKAQHYVREALHRPVEGTIISVLAAVADVPAADTLDATVGAMAKAAHTAMEHTPEQLEDLHGVIDAGAAGLVVVLGALQEAMGQVTEPELPSGQVEVMMYATNANLSGLESELESLGDCLVIGRAGDDEANIHIHTVQPEAVLKAARAFGTISDVRVEALPEAPRAGRVLIVIDPPEGAVPLLNDAEVKCFAADDELIPALTSLNAAEVLIFSNLDLQTLHAIDRALQRVGIHTAWLPGAHLLRILAAVTVHDPSQSFGVALLHMQEAALGMHIATIAENYSVHIGDYEVARCNSLEQAIETASSLLHSCGGEQRAIAVRPGSEVVDSAMMEIEGLACLAEIGVE
ncbi:DAK2 domain-containing protein [Corynebacterium gerontici]|uniref:DAK2 domain protein n=1 Tax=Corynebacterium gerontici TaxID=2079234 RepID=A0A3G6IZU8_9CORY|nr:DAK2 domain-containing protein [Corynebacterium gerontici]AZA11311.1 DAK2 domain protein [Corynebacterium gerontici]